MGPSDRHRRGRQGSPGDAAPRRRLGSALLAVVVVLAWPGPAGADPAKPTNYRSRVVAVRGPTPPGFAVRVVGGDAFLEVRVPAGHTASVADYPSGPGTTTAPYLRFGQDGTVRRNDASVAAVANRNRFGRTNGTPEPGGRPRWTVVARNGRYAWHDHRIHWMSPNAPTHLGPGGRVDLGGQDGRWEVPLRVDGRPVRVIGELTLLPAPSPVLPLAVGALASAAVIGAAVGCRRRQRAFSPLTSAALVGGAGVVATWVGWSAWRAVPPGTGPSFLVVAVPLLAVVVAPVITRARGTAALASVAAGVAAVVGWAVSRVGVFDHAVLPTSLPGRADPLLTALAAGVSIGLAVVLAWAPNVVAPRHRVDTASTASATGW